MSKFNKNNANNEINADLNFDVAKKNTIYKRTKMTNFGLPLRSFYGQKPMWQVMGITIITAIVFGVISVFFVKNVGIYNFGLAAFGQSIARLITVSMPESVAANVRNMIDQLVYWIAYIVLSIPIFIFGYKKIGKTFTNLTVIFLVVSSFISFGIGLIDGANDVYFIGDFSNKIVKNSLNEYQKALSPIIPLLWNDGGNIIALMIYSLTYGFLLSWIFAIIQIIGGTAGVTGIIGEWYANEKQKSFASISGYMNIVIILICVAVGSYIPGSMLLKSVDKSLVQDEQVLMVLNKAWSFELYLSPNFVATVLTNFIYILVLNKLFPKFKLVRVEIFSKHYMDISERLAHDTKIVTGVTVFKGLGGYSGKEVNVVTSIALFRQVPRIIKAIRDVDSEAFISISDIASIDGHVYLPTNKF